ncbi:MAG: isoprenylcysteine carboxylmethyltransferase family protein [Bacteroidia bacterium]|nr:isoprenylcysteine carboxylmethyltransferase family protein [Bacteroidia bacterium]
MTFSQFLFRNRSYTPLPFLVVMMVFARPTLISLGIGFAIAALGEFVRAWGVFYVGSETRVTGEVGASRLVTSGPFAHVRNPLYVGNILLYVGVGVMSLALFPWLQLVALLWFIFQYTLIVREEERFLREKFGKEYEDYCTAVPRFLFRPTAFQSSAPVKINWKAGWQSEARSLQAFAVATLLLVVIWLLR